MQIDFSQFSSYVSNRLTGVRYVRTWFSHKILSLPATADNRRFACKVELSSTLQASRRSMPGIDYDSAINAHICCNSVPGVSAAYENQALSSRRADIRRTGYRVKRPRTISTVRDIFMLRSCDKLYENFHINKRLISKTSHKIICVPRRHTEVWPMTVLPLGSERLLWLGTVKRGSWDHFRDAPLRPRIFQTLQSAGLGVPHMSCVYDFYNICSTQGELFLQHFPGTDPYHML